MYSLFLRSGVSLAVAGLWASSAAAQVAALPPTLPQVTVTGNPLGSSDLIAPAAQVSGAQLLGAPSTLGQTLDTLPGVSSTYFGPNASRPIIRGQDGDCIRILSNGGAALDASGLSFDHAVPMDPISVERIEVLRGPGALLYGGSAAGGVVNIIDNRIPKEPSGFVGRADLGFASGNRERNGAVLLEGGNQRFGVHADIFKRSSSDVAAPKDLACTQGGITRTAQRICNSAAQTDGGAFGGSVFFDQGYVGAAISTYNSTYGTVAEDEVTIGMRSQRYALAGEIRNLGAATGGLLKSVKGQLNRTDYSHTEFDAGAAGTVFKNAGNDWRFEATHGTINLASGLALQGVVGLQGENSAFSADGLEAFAPYSKSRSSALFIYEELPTSWGKFSLGARTESVRVESLGNPQVARFDVGQRSFAPSSAAFGALVNLPSGFKLTGNLAHSQRAPKDYELFANGPHLATGAYEVGNSRLALEKSTQLDAGVAWQSGVNKVQVTVFTSRFSNFLGLENTGLSRDTDGNGQGVGVTDCGDGTSLESGCAAGVLPEFAYRAVRARFSGLEASGTVGLIAGQGSGPNAGGLNLEWRADSVRATNLSTGQPLSRIAPARVGATLAWNMAAGAAPGALNLRVGFDRSAAQTRVPAGERATPGYTVWNLSATYRAKLGTSDVLWFAKLDNATDRLAFSASSILSQTAPGKAPLPGRSLKVGLQANF